MTETPLSLEDLRGAFAALSTNAAPGPDCPTADAILEAVRGEAPARSTVAVVDHTSRCYACAEAWRLGRELAGVTTSGRARAFRAPVFGVWASLAAAAVLLIVAGIGFFVRPQSGQPIVTRAGEETAIRSLVPETTPLPRGACVLRWSAAPGEARYNIRLGMQDLTPIASARGLEKPEYQIPPKSLERIPADATLLWRVEAPTFMNRVE